MLLAIRLPVAYFRVLYMWILRICLLRGLKNRSPLIYANLQFKKAIQLLLITLWCAVICIVCTPLHVCLSFEQCVVQYCVKRSTTPSAIYKQCHNFVQKQVKKVKSQIGIFKSIPYQFFFSDSNNQLRYFLIFFLKR